MSVIVTDNGFGEDDFDAPITPLAEENAQMAAVSIATDAEPNDLAALATREGLRLIRIDVPKSADGRGFTLARLLRQHGYQGRLRLAGHVLADQYSMARRAGVDEVEIDEALAARQPEAHWMRRANWQAHDYQARLRGTTAQPLS